MSPKHDNPRKNELYFLKFKQLRQARIQMLKPIYEKGDEYHMKQ